MTGTPARRGVVHTEEWSCPVAASPGALWQAIERLDGTSERYSWGAGWRLRGLLDTVVGGPGLRRGRRDPSTLVVGDVVDFWRVAEIHPGELLLLRAEMRLPGRAWLELRVDGDDDGGTVYRQTVRFEASGPGGRLYWWSAQPFHGLAFGPVRRSVVQEARRLDLVGGQPDQERPA